MKDKKIPLRKCVTCNERKPKSDLVRIVKKNEKEIEIDLTGKANGRGAYLCLDLKCLDEVEKTKRLSRSMGIEVSKDVYEELRKLIKSISK
jgi:uncharacterized protein